MCLFILVLRMYIYNYFASLCLYDCMHVNSDEFIAAFYSLHKFARDKDIGGFYVHVCTLAHTHAHSLNHLPPHCALSTTILIHIICFFFCRRYKRNRILLIIILVTAPAIV